MSAERDLANEIAALAELANELLASARARACATPTVRALLLQAVVNLDDAARRMNLVADDRGE